MHVLDVSDLSVLSSILKLDLQCNIEHFLGLRRAAASGVGLLQYSQAGMGGWCYCTCQGREGVVILARTVEDRSRRGFL